MARTARAQVSAVIALAAAGAAPAIAQAPARLALTIEPALGARYGDAHTLTGRLLRDGRPLAGTDVEVEAERYPFTDGLATVRTLRTGADGRFTLRRRFDRNHRVRVSAPNAQARSAVETAYTFPAGTLSYARAREGVVRLTQTYRVPRDVRLTTPTRFYLGRASRGTAPFRASAATRRVAPGRFVSRVRVRLPEVYDGRFRYASCFRYNARAGMGDPDAGCPRASYTFP